MLTVSVTGTAQVNANLIQIESRLHQEIEKELTRSAATVLADSQRNAPKAWGNLARGGKMIQKPGSREVLFNANYAAAVEFGRKPGKWPPFQAILDWVHKRGLAGVYAATSRRRIGSTERMMSEDRPLAFLIQRSIGKKGTRPHPFLFPAFEKERPRLIERLKTLAR